MTFVANQTSREKRMSPVVFTLVRRKTVNSQRHWEIGGGHDRLP
jgi:hypothetical protein